jgi:two-component system nitrate/nitrite response regulator NarL
MAVTVLIVDDHAGFRELARRMLESGGFEVVAEAGNAAEADLSVRQLHPELVLLDVQLPGEDGLALSRRLTGDPAGPAVVLTSSRDARDYGRRLEECGACGFIPKAQLTWQAVEALLEKEGKPA